VAVEIPLHFAFDVVRFHILVVFYKNELFSHKSAMRKEVIFFLKGFDGKHFLLGKIVILKLLDLIFLVLHPQNSAAIEIKRDGYFRHPKLSMQFDFVFVCIDFIHVLVFDFELDG
jgi:hypothetical protein